MQGESRRFLPAHLLRGPFCWRPAVVQNADSLEPARQRTPNRRLPLLPNVTPVDGGSETCVVFLLGYPGVGKRTVGSHLAELLDGVLVDNQLINIPLLTLFKWDGKFLLPMEIWERVGPIREAVLGTIEDLAPRSNSYVFTNVLEDDEDGASQYDRIRSLAQRRGSLFLSVMLDCEVDEQVRRIDTPDRIDRLKGSDPEGYKRHRHQTKLFQPPPGDVVHIDTTKIRPRQNAETIYTMLLSRGFRRPST